MKPETATVLTVTLLLAGSALCLGVRHAIDTPSESAWTPEDRIGGRARSVVEAGKTSGMEPPAAGPSGPEAMTKQLRSLLLTANDADRTRALLELVSRFETGDWPLALEALAKIDIVLGSPGYDLILFAWTEADPEAAMAWATQKQIGYYAIRAWIGKDPDAALAFLTSPASGDPSSQWSRMARAIEVLGDDLPRIAKLISATQGSQRLMLVQQARPNFGKISPETAKAWVDSLDPSLKDHGLNLLLTNLQGVEAKLALARDFPDEIGPEKYGSIYDAWMKSDEAAALASFESLEPGRLHRAALLGVAHGLCRNGKFPEAIALTKRWPEETTDLLLSDLMIGRGTKNAALVLGEIPRLKSESLRLDRYRHALEPWLKEDPEAAKKWLRENEVPEQIRKEFEGR